MHQLLPPLAPEIFYPGEGLEVRMTTPALLHPSLSVLLACFLYKREVKSSKSWRSDAWFGKECLKCFRECVKPTYTSISGILETTGCLNHAAKIPK